jgi:crossover junction endodeoxyribonuclease RusA
MSLFVVPGTPAPQGSFKPMASKSTGKPFLAVNTAGGFLRYRADVRAAAEREEGGAGPRQGAVSLTLIFVFPRPEQHWLPANSRREEPVLRPGAPAEYIGTPDVDKVCRAVMDALTGIAYRDDAQVTSLTAVKLWSNEHGGGGKTTIAISTVETI